MNNLRLALILAVAFTLRALSAATVTAELSADETSVGTPVQLQVRVEGTTNVIMPPTIDVAGLDARMAGRSNSIQVQVINGRLTTSSSYAYTIIPMREGTFEIPSVEITVDGKKQRTAPQRLVVQPGNSVAQGALPPSAGAPSRRRNAAADGDDEGKLFYGEILVPRKEIYVGEVVPVEVRFYFNERGSFRLVGQEPQVNGEGFTVEKFSPPRQTEELVGNSGYQVLSFKTAITAVKSGEMLVPKASLLAVARVPSRGPQQMDDIFSQLLGGQGMGFSEDKEIKVESVPTKIRVKALPVEGRPENFSGAVGEFTLSGSVDSAKTAPGDPVTLRIAISGRGNFNGMGEPKLIDTDGWRVYPPTDKFEKSDSLGLSGTKTFEMPLVAQQPQTRTPVAEFSYFDPVKEKYFTIRSQPIAVSAAAAPAVAAAGPEASATPSPSAQPAPDATGLWLVQSTPRSWQSRLQQPAFWIGNGIAAGIFLALLGGMAVRHARSGPAAARAMRVRERNRLLGEIVRGGLTNEVFYAKAHEVLTMQAALAGESGPFEFIHSLETRGRDTSDLRAILARADEIKFSGGGAAVPGDAGEQRRIAGVLREVCR